MRQVLTIQMEIHIVGESTQRARLIADGRYMENALATHAKLLVDSRHGAELVTFAPERWTTVSDDSAELVTFSPVARVHEDHSQEGA